MKTFVAVVGIVLVSAAALLAQEPITRADQKVLGHYNGYKPYTAHAYQSNAMTHARTLEQYHAAAGTVPKEVVTEHAAEVRRNVAAVDKELVKLEGAVKQDKIATDLLAEIKAHQAAALKACGMAETEAAKPQGGTVASCCTTMTTELKAAADAHAKLMAHLKIAPPAGPVAAPHAPASGK